MKFHHLARRSSNKQQYCSPQTQMLSAANHINTTSNSVNQHKQRDSPAFLNGGAGAGARHQNQNQIVTDDEEDDKSDIVEDYTIADPQTLLYDQLINRNHQDNASQSVLQQQIISSSQHHHHHHHHHQQHQMDSEAGNPAASFLMDKNKKLFPQKLWELIHNPSIQHCLRWSQDGQRVYLNRNEFEAYYLKTPNNQFHTQKAISFVRQMNMYGFRKVDDCYYENDNFRRDKQHLLRNMIRRHPNKGIFVGMDQHQLAAAAVAQQALHVNQQFQHQLEQQHKQRAEQALRLNNYLNSNQQRFQQQHNHQQQQQHHQHQQQIHGNHNLAAMLDSPFEQSLSSQLAQQLASSHLAAAAVAQQNQFQNHTDDNLSLNIDTSQQQQPINQSVQQLQQQQQHSQPVHHQPKKSRLLSNFYAAAAAAASSVTNNNNRQVIGSNNNATSNQLALINQDSMHSNSSVDTQPSQCSSAINSGSAGSPRPSSPGAPATHQKIQQQQQHQLKQQDSSSSIRQVLAAAAAAAASQPASTDTATNLSLSNFKNATNHDGHQQHSATDLSNHQSRQAALHETLVRSLLQLKQQQQHQQHHHPRDILASLAQQQHQNSRYLIESLASLSSAGTGSIVDPTSNSPTERTATPPSSHPSPIMATIDDDLLDEDDNDEEREVDDDRSQRRVYVDSASNMVLNLAKSYPTAESFNEFPRKQTDGEKGLETGKQIDTRAGERTETGASDVDDESEDVCESEANLPLDGAKKVRRFLDAQMEQMLHRCSSSSSPNDDIEGGKNNRSIKREYSSDEQEFPQGMKDGDIEQLNKRLKLSANNVAASEEPKSQAKSLIVNMLSRKGDKLEPQALDEAARYTQCFLNTLLDDAALIAGHSTTDDESSTRADEDEKEDSSGSEVSSKASVIDSSSLSLALKLIPSKLIAAIQQQQQQPVVVANE